MILVFKNKFKISLTKIRQKSKLFYFSFPRRRSSGGKRAVLERDFKWSLSSPRSPLEMRGASGCATACSPECTMLSSPFFTCVNGGLNLPYRFLPHGRGWIFSVGCGRCRRRDCPDRPWTGRPARPSWRASPASPPAWGWAGK